MEKKIDISELLKDCPKGMRVDCVLYNDVVLHEVHLDNRAFPIVFFKEQQMEILLLLQNMGNIPIQKIVNALYSRKAKPLGRDLYHRVNLRSVIE